LSFLSDILGTGISGIMDGASSIIDQFVTDPDKKLEASLKLKDLEYQSKVLALDAKKAELENTANAREMYQKDSSLQKTFAIVFLVGYLIITGFLIYSIFFSDVFRDMANWEVALISTVFTAMSTKVNTIVDFLFGGSQSGDESAKNVNKILNLDKTS
jgi:hypothetical protein